MSQPPVQPALPPLEVLDIVVTFTGDMVSIHRRKFEAEFPPKTVIAACNVIREYVEMGLRGGAKKK
jgi:hypothetical protein